jgi:PAS domain S-box-containing protein
MKIANRFGVYIIIISLVTFSLFAVVMEVGGRQMIRTNVEAHLNGVNAIEIADYERWINSKLQQMTAFASRPLVKNYSETLLSSSPNEFDYQLAVEQLYTVHFPVLVEAKDGFLNLSIIDPQTGKIIISSDKNREGLERKDVRYFIEGQSHPFVQGLYISPYSREISMTISTPIVQDGQLITVLAGQMNLRGLADIIAERVDEHETEMTFIVSKTDQIIVFLPYQNPQLKSFIEELPEVSRCLEGEDFIATFDDYLENPKIGVFDWVPEHDLCFVTEIGEKEAFQIYNIWRQAILVSGLFIIFIEIILSYYLSRRITAPVNKLVEGTQEIGKGNFNFRFDIQWDDELGMISQAFNLMVDNLQIIKEKTEYRQNILYSLSKSTEEMLRADSQTTLFKIIGRFLRDFSYNAVLFIVSDNYLQVKDFTFENELIDAIERDVSFAIRDIRLRFDQTSILSKPILDDTSIFLDHLEDFREDILPSLTREEGRLLFYQLELQRGIFVRINVRDEIERVLMFVGKELSEADIPVMEVLANQIAAALENMRLYQSVSGWMNEIEHMVASRSVAMASSQSRYREFFENASVAMYRTTLDGTRFLDVNQKMSLVTGYSREELMNSQPLMFWKDPSKRKEMVEHIIKFGEVTKYPVQLLSKSGKELVVVISVKFVEDEGVIEGLLIDISDYVGL